VIRTPPKALATRTKPNLSEIRMPPKASETRMKPNLSEIRTPLRASETKMPPKVSEIRTQPSHLEAITRPTAPKTLLRVSQFMSTQSS
jgi:hypothetical protein